MKNVTLINPRKPRAVFLYTMHNNMKNTIVTVIYSLILLLLLTCNLAAAEGKPELQKVRHTVLSPTSEQVTLQLNGSYSPKVFTLKGETPRIIFDFPDMTYGREVQGNTTTKGSIVKRIRVGMHTDETLKTRIVFDVAALQGVTYNQKFDDESLILSIQFTADAKKAALGAKNKTAPPPDKGISPSEDAAPETVDSKSVQPPPAVTADSQALPKTETVQTGSEAKSQPETKAPILQPTDSAEKTEEKKTIPASPAAKSQPEASADSKTTIQTKTTQTENTAKPQPAPQEAASKAAVPIEKAEEKKIPAPATAPPQPVTTTNAKPSSAKTETIKPAATTGGTVGPLIESVKFDGASPKGEMVLFKLNDFHPPVIHGVEEGVPRVICDFNSTQIVDSVKNLIKTDGKHVKLIRISKHKKPERIRVVLDLEPNRSYDLQQVFFKEDNLFVIIVNTIKK